MSTKSVKGRKAGTACDRCYALKERCTRSSNIVSCTRCQRLDQRCTTIRPVRKAGRRVHRPETTAPPRTTRSSQSSTDTISVRSIDIEKWLFNETDLDVEEKQSLTFLLAQPENLEKYPVNPSFQGAEQRSLAAALPTALSTLKHAYMAFAGALKLLHMETGTEKEKSASLRHASVAMQTLRCFVVSNSKDAAVCLTLGASLALFVYSVVGVGVADICRYCLSTTSPFIGTLQSSAHSDIRPWQSVLILLETMECLVYRRKPTLRIECRGTATIDRHVGLCLPLLPYYYDLCDISHSLVHTTDPDYLIHLQKQLDKTHNALLSWQPSPSGNFINELDTAEVLSFLTQARVYRLAALLVSHRLQHVFGEQDRQARIWSNEIMMDLDLTREIIKRPIRCVTLPFVVAAVEVTSTEARVKTLEDVDQYVDQFTPVVQKATRSFLERIWHERDQRLTACWLDSIHKPCVILHSIDPSMFPCP